MIYVIDHKDSFTHNVVHQLSLFDKVECDDFSKINKSKLNKASTIVFSPGSLDHQRIIHYLQKFTNNLRVKKK
jgi:anthranilate/para-aminobenzoate synthase component II